MQLSHRARRGLRCAVVFSNTNAGEVPIAAGVAELCEVVVDGVTGERRHLIDKPAADTFLAGARARGLGNRTGGGPEDALAGVQADGPDASGS